MGNNFLRNWISRFLMGNDEMKLLYLPLIILTFSAIMTQMIATGQYDYVRESDLDSDPFFSNQTIDGSPQTGELEGYEVTAGFDLESGVIAIIVVMIAIGVIAGIQVLGSGLSDFSVSVIYKSVFFYSIWIIISAFGYDALGSIPIIGSIFYFILTLFYSLGVAQQIQGS